LTLRQTPSESPKPTDNEPQKLRDFYRFLLQIVSRFPPRGNRRLILGTASTSAIAHWES
jgi:hypothetical protein